MKANIITFFIAILMAGFVFAAISCYGNESTREKLIKLITSKDEPGIERSVGILVLKEKLKNINIPEEINKRTDLVPEFFSVESASNWNGKILIQVTFWTKEDVTGIWENYLNRRIKKLERKIKAKREQIKKLKEGNYVK